MGRISADKQVACLVQFRVEKRRRRPALQQQLEVELHRLGRKAQITVEFACFPEQKLDFSVPAILL